jgi:hypothetical protein
MIRPGLFTASTSSADHFGMSADCLVCLSIVVAPSFGLFLFFEEGVSPSQRKKEHDWVAQRRTCKVVTEWRTGMEHREMEVASMGCRERMKRRGGKELTDFVVSSRRGCEYTKEDAEQIPVSGHSEMVSATS